MSSSDRDRGKRRGEEDTLAVGADTFNVRAGLEDTHASGQDPTLDSGDPEPASSGRLPARGERFAHFEVLDVLGRGGMSVVLAAHDVDLDRTIALKVMRADAAGDSQGPSAQARLLREAQALARLSHPNVVTVHEVGIEGERVYLAMEKVEGSTATAWLREATRSWREVVAVFKQAAAGLAAAHAAGFVHRDVKPDNILVRRDGRVVVTDFGLVSAAGEPGAGASGSTPAVRSPTPMPTPLPARTPLPGAGPLAFSLTHTGTMLGTPAYMAPEQHLHRSVDARADQFGFCVSLFEALFGKRPFRGDSYNTLRTAVTEGRIVAPPDDSPVPAWLRKVVLRGLATAPQDRYSSMDELLAALSNDPAVRRRRLGTIAAIGGGFVALAALAAFGMSRSTGTAPPSPCQVSPDELAGAWDADVRRAVERALVETRRAHAPATWSRVAALLDAQAGEWLEMRREACVATRVRGTQSEHLLDLRTQCLARRKDELAALTAVLAKGSDPEVLNRAVGAASALTPMAACADVAALDALVPLPDDPSQRERVLAVGRRLDEVEALSRTGQWGKAVESIAAVVTEARAIAHPPTLARALLAQGRALDKSGKPQEAEPVLRETLDAAAGARDHTTIARAWVELVEVVGFSQVRSDDALAMQQSAELAVKVTGDATLAAELDRTLGRVLLKKGDFASSRRHAEAAVAGFEHALGKDSASVAASLQGLAIVSARLGDFSAAQAHYERALAIFRAALGEDHPAVGGVLNDMGALLSHQDRHAAARPYYEQAAVVFERSLGAAHPHVATVVYNLGVLTRDLGDPGTALGHFQKAEEVYRAALGPDHPDVASAVASQGVTLQVMGRFDEARVLFDRGLAMIERALGPDHVETAVVLESIALLEQDIGQLDAARARYDRVLAIEEQAYGKENPELGDTLLNLGSLEALRGHPRDARRHLERALALAERGHGPASTTTAIVLHALGDLERQEGRHPAALERLALARAIFERELGPAHPDLGVTLTSMGQSQLALGRTAEAVTTLRQAVAISEKAPSDATSLPLARLALGRALWESGEDRAAARAMVEDAAGALAKLGPGNKAAHKAAETWLRAH